MISCQGNEIGTFNISTFQCRHTERFPDNSQILLNNSDGWLITF